MRLSDVPQPDEVKRAGDKVVALADSQGWSDLLLLLTCRALGEFLSEVLGVDGSDSTQN